MKLSVIGTGYLGAVHAAAMSEFGHEVVGVDVDPQKVAALAGGDAPFHEPGFPELLAKALESGRLRFSADFADIEDADVHFLTVGTPQRPGRHAADLRYVDAAIDSMRPHLHPGALVAGKSTVPVGTAARLAETVRGVGAELAWNPEFLREGFAVQDTLAPDRLVYGIGAGPGTPDWTGEDEHVVEVLDEVYAPIVERETPRIVTDFATAELVKVAANAFLATKISFINAMAEIAEATGADVTTLADAIGHDQRIGRKFLNAGVGFGGGCLPKDIRGFVARAEELGKAQSVGFLREVDEINLRRRDRVVDLVLEALDGGYHGAKVAVLGLAFKPDSDDVRDSPALNVAVRLRGLGVNVVATDPEAIENSRRLHPQLSFARTAEEALVGAEVVVLVTEWAEYRELDPAATLELVSSGLEAARVRLDAADGEAAPRTIIDARNVLDPKAWREAGWRYEGLGRH